MLSPDIINSNRETCLEKIKSHLHSATCWQENWIKAVSSDSNNNNDNNNKNIDEDWVNPWVVTVKRWVTFMTLIRSCKKNWKWNTWQQCCYTTCLNRLNWTVWNCFIGCENFKRFPIKPCDRPYFFHSAITFFLRLLLFTLVLRSGALDSSSRRGGRGCCARGFGRGGFRTALNNSGFTWWHGHVPYYRRNTLKVLACRKGQIVDHSCRQRPFLYYLWCLMFSHFHSCRVNESTDRVTAQLLLGRAFSHTEPVAST